MDTFSGLPGCAHRPDPAKVEAQIEEGCRFYTDEAGAYNRVATSGRKHATLTHSEGEFACDEDGVREVTATPVRGFGQG